MENWELTEEDWNEWARHLIEASPDSETRSRGAAVPPQLNLAGGQTAIQSSVNWDGVAGRAVDGITDGTYNNNSVTHTQTESQPWWQVDLKNTYVLDDIQISNRTDCCTNRLSNFYVLVSNNDMRGKTLNQLLADPDVWSVRETGQVYGSRTYSTPTTGRFVRVQLAGSGVLSLAEVKVYGVNLAPGKSATQSSTGWGGSASRAIDNNADGDASNNSVTSTTDSAFPWWQLDLGQRHDIGRIWLFNRTDCCQDRFAHFYVFASDNDMSGKTIDELRNDPDVWEHFEAVSVASRYMVPAGNAKGRYIRIQRNTTGILSIAEVVVNGAPSAQASTEQLNPAEFGRWDEPIEWPHISVHASVLPTGDLLTWDASPDDFTEPVHDPHTSPNNTVRATVWDPDTGVHTQANTTNGVDLFCAGTNYLPDGRLFSAGGTTDYNGKIHATTLFDSADSSWSSGPDMNFARWYPTVTDLASGDMLISGGRAATPELYSFDTNSVRSYPGLTVDEFWPIIRQAPNGNIVYAGGDSNTNVYTIDLGGNGSLNPENLNEPLITMSSHAMYDIGKVLYAGGGGGGKTYRDAFLLDLNSMQITEAEPMGYRRARINLTILADGTVMAVGGAFGSPGCDEENSSYAGEIWNPDTGKWTVMASQDRPRHYHSTSVLLPDGRVWSGGGGYATNVTTQEARCKHQKSSEIFSPPYLFNADGSLATRPTITSAPDTAVYDTSYTVQTPNANQINKVALVKLSSVTHKLNMGQRYVPLEYSVVNGNELSITTPASTLEATAGVYMLFIINNNGTPSVSQMVHLQEDGNGGGNPGGGGNPTPPSSTGSWELLSGSLSHVSHGSDGSIWGVGANNTAFRRQDGNSNWDSLPSVSFKQIDALDYDNAIGLTEDGDIYYYDNGGWTQIQGRLSHISYGADGSVWGVNAANIPWRRITADGGSSLWQSRPFSAGNLVQIDALDYDTAIGVTDNDEIYLYSNGNWTQISGVLSYVSYGVDGSLWGVNANNNVYRRPSTAPGSWELVASHPDMNNPVQIDALNYESAVGLDMDDSIWRYNLSVTIAASLDPTTPVVTNSTVNFSATATGGSDLTYSWDFGDGTVTPFSTSATASHSYQTAGRYNVSVTVRDVSGAETIESMLQAVYAPHTANTPTQSSSILYDTSNDHVWNVNPDNNSVTVISADNLNNIDEIAVGDEPRSIALADSTTIWVANKADSTISVIDTGSRTVVQTIALPYGSSPHGMAMAPNGSAMYVVLEASGQLLKFNPATGSQIGTVDVGQHARHVSVSHDGSNVYVVRFITPPIPGEGGSNPSLNGQGGEIVVVNGGTMTVADTILVEPSLQIDSESGARGIPNYLGALAISPDGVSGWVPSKQDNVERGGLRDGQALNHDQTLRNITSLIDLTTDSENRSARIDHDDAGIPSAATYDTSGNYLFIAMEASREIAVLDAYGMGEIARISVGRAPQGVVVSPDGQFLFVHNFMDRTVEAIDLTDLMGFGQTTTVSSVATISTVASESLAADVLVGKQLFYDAEDDKMALQNYISCASCHNGGGQDGRVWDFTDRGEGVRNTTSLEGHANQGALHWSGNFDEFHDFEGQIRTLSGGLGLMTTNDFNTTTDPLGAPKAGLSADLDALAAYMQSLVDEGDSPFRDAAGALTAAGVAGRDLFVANNCAACHSGAEFTDSAVGVRHDIGSLTSASGSRLGGLLDGLDTPTLRGLWNTAPYLHDGSAQTVADAVNAHDGINITGTDLNNLVSYLLQIDENESIAPVPPTSTPTNTPVPPTATSIPPTNTPTNTPIPPTATSIPPTNTPTNTPVPGPSCTTYSSGDTPISLPNGTASLNSSLTVPSSATISDINVDVDMPHDWPGDLIFTLAHNGTSVVVIDQPDVPASNYGCQNDDILVTLDDEAAASVENQCSSSPPAISGTFQPNNALSAFDGISANGTWTLSVEDTYTAADPGTLNSWSIEICSGNSAPPIPTNTPVPVPTNTPPAGPSVVYVDSFETNQGWTVNPNGTDNATKGMWEIANPQGTDYNGAKQVEDAFDGSNGLVTAASAGSSVGTNDIDNGVTSVRSPNITLPANNTYNLTFAYYLAHTYNSSADDYLRVTVVGTSGSSVVLEEFGNSVDDDAVWEMAVISLDSFAGQTIYLLVSAADDGNGSIVEAGIDAIQISENNVVSLQASTFEEILIDRSPPRELVGLPAEDSETGNVPLNVHLTMSETTRPSAFVTVVALIIVALIPCAGWHIIRQR